MAAKKGNKNALGNSGGKEWGKGNREKAAILKGLVIDWATKVMKGENEQLKKEVALKLATTCIPTVIEGDDESPLVVKVINYARNNYTPPIQPENISVRVPTSTSTLQSGCMEPKSWQEQDRTKPTDN